MSTGKPIWDYPAEFRAPPGEGCKACGIILREDSVLGYCSPECAEYKDRCLVCEKGPTWCECQLEHDIDPTIIYVIQNDAGTVIEWYASGADAMKAVNRFTMKSMTWQSLFFETHSEGIGAYGNSAVTSFVEKARKDIEDPFWNPNDFPDDGYPEYRTFPIKLGTPKIEQHELAERLCEKWGQIFEETKNER